jgi:hypothetical protein
VDPFVKTLARGRSRIQAGSGTFDNARAVVSITSVSGGGSVGSRAALTSPRTKVLVGGLCIRSRPGAALLNVGAPRSESP